jgi:small-conductance mechanosensitive channel
MRRPLWVPSAEYIKQANITRFIGLVNKRHGLEISSYDELYRWSIENMKDFWGVFWDFVDVKASGYDAVVDDLRRFPGAKWFVGARLNFTIVIVGLITALGTMGSNVSALVAGLGLTGFALGFALRDSISNLIAGVLILVYQPFTINSRIKVAGYEGTVVSIDLRYTVIESEGAKVLIPNSKLFTNPITVLK